MKRILVMLGAISVPVSLLVSVASFAQNPQPSPEAGVVVQGRMAQGPEGPPFPPDPANTFVFVATEMGFGGKVVKGAPYSAEAVTETVQNLADGNRIVNKMTSTLYRDSEGRTRREQTLKAIGNYAGEPIQTIFINDPVAGVSYALDSSTRVAHKSMPFKVEHKMLPPGMPAIGLATAPAPDGPKFEMKLESKRMLKPDGVAAVPPPGAEQIIIRTEGPGEPGALGYSFKRRADDDKNQVKESLGTQVIEGVSAEGTRVTITIPEGEIGNERPIEIVSERWYSPELQMVVMSKHRDPRAGETTYRLTNINRAEPAKSLFEVPPGFTVSEGFPGLLKQGPVPAKIKKPTSPE